MSPWAPVILGALSMYVGRTLLSEIPAGWSWAHSRLVSASRVLFWGGVVLIVVACLAAIADGGPS